MKPSINRPRLAAALFIMGLCSFMTTTVGASTVKDGRQVFRSKRCGECHTVKRPGKPATYADALKKKGPDLWFAGSKFKKAWLETWLQDPQPIRQMGFNSILEKNQETHKSLSERESRSVAEYLMTLVSTEVTKGIIKGGKSFKGKLIFEKKGACYGCHLVRRGRRLIGGLSGPSLVEAGMRLQGDWIYTFLKRPDRLTPPVRMPRFSDMLSDSELKELAIYIGGLK